MGIPFHSIDAVDGFNEFAFVDRAEVGINLAVSYPSGAAGVTVTQTVAIPASANMPTNYFVSVELGFDGTWFITSKSATGFTLNVSPRLAANSVAAGTANIMIVA